MFKWNLAPKSIELTGHVSKIIFLIKSKEPGNVNYTEIGGTEQCILTMEVENFKELHNKMKQNGAHVTDIENNAGCGLNFYAYDPAGNKIDLWSGWPK